MIPIFYMKIKSRVGIGKNILKKHKRLHLLIRNLIAWKIFGRLAKGFSNVYVRSQALAIYRLSHYFSNQRFQKGRLIRGTTGYFFFRFMVFNLGKKGQGDVG